MFGLVGKRAVEGSRAGLYAIYDRVAEEAGPCYLAINDGVAVRAYRQLMSGSNVVAQDEYVLYKVGFYNVKTMEVESMEPVRVVVPPIVDDLLQIRLPGTEVTHV